MREIKFRAWNKKVKILATVLEWFCNGRVGVSILDSGPFLWRDAEDIVLMQYTGLSDKNGKEIYEGDITLYGFDPTARPYEVIFQTGSFTLKGYEIEDYYGNDDPILNNWAEDMEIIGNIHENPELLK